MWAPKFGSWRRKIEYNTVLQYGQTGWSIAGKDLVLERGLSEIVWPNVGGLLCGGIYRFARSERGDPRVFSGCARTHFWVDGVQADAKKLK